MANTRIPPLSGRHQVLIDVENLAATANPTCEDVQMVREALTAVMRDFGIAHRIVACSHHAAPTVALAFPGARHLWRSGPNGADLALLDVLENEHVDRRFGRVTLCSGDGIFAASAARLAVAKVDVTVVALEGHLAARLEIAARHVVRLRSARRLVAIGDAS